MKVRIDYICPCHSTERGEATILANDSCCKEINRAAKSPALEVVLKITFKLVGRNHFITMLAMHKDFFTNFLQKRRTSRCEKRIQKLVIALAVAALIAFTTQPVYMADGSCDYFLLMLFIGIPFGIRQMFLWIVPIGHSLATTVGIVALNILVGGLIGIIVFAVTVITGMVSLILAVVSGLCHVVTGR